MVLYGGANSPKGREGICNTLKNKIQSGTKNSHSCSPPLKTVHSASTFKYCLVQRLYGMYMPLTRQYCRISVSPCRKLTSGIQFCPYSFLPSTSTRKYTRHCTYRKQIDMLTMHN